MTEIGDGHDELREAVRQKRRKDHLTAAAFERLAGISHKTLTGFLSGERETHEDNIGRIETAVGWHDEAPTEGSILDSQEEAWIRNAPLPDAAKDMMRAVLVAYYSTRPASS